MGILRQAQELGIFPLSNAVCFNLPDPCAAVQYHGGLGSGAGYGAAVRGWIEIVPKLVIPAATQYFLRSSEGLRPSQEGLGSPPHCQPQSPAISGVAGMGDLRRIWGSEVEQQGQVRDPSPQGLGEGSQLFPSLKSLQQQCISFLCLTADAPCAPLAAGEVGTKLHGAACSGFSSSCPREVFSLAIASSFCSPRVCRAAGGTLGGSWSPGCIVTHERGGVSAQSSWSNSSVGLPLPHCSVCRANCAGCVGHGTGTWRSDGWLEQPAWQAVLPPAGQTAGELCFCYLELAASPRVTRSCSVGRKQLWMMQTRRPRSWGRTCLSSAFCASPSSLFSCEDDG